MYTDPVKMTDEQLDRLAADLGLTPRRQKYATDPVQWDIWLKRQFAATAFRTDAQNIARGKAALRAVYQKFAAKGGPAERNSAKRKRIAKEAAKEIQLTDSGLIVTPQKATVTRVATRETAKKSSPKKTPPPLPPRKKQPATQKKFSLADLTLTWVHPDVTDPKWHPGNLWKPFYKVSQMIGITPKPKLYRVFSVSTYQIFGETISEKGYDMLWELPMNKERWDKKVYPTLFEDEDSGLKRYLFTTGDKFHFLELRSADEMNVKLSPQEFADGPQHCVLGALRGYYNRALAEAKSDRQKTRFDNLLKKLDGFDELYKDKGIPESEMPALAKALNTTIVVNNLFGKEYMKFQVPGAPHRIIFTNTRYNHVDLGTFSKQNAEKVDDVDAVLAGIRKENKSYIRQTHDGETTFLCTAEKAWKKSRPENEVMEAWESKHPCLAQSWIVNDPMLTQYCKAAQHMSAAEVYWRPESEYEDEADRMIAEAFGDIPGIPEYGHIDMEKNYAHPEKCQFYEGFPIKISDLRKCDFSEKDLEKHPVGLYEVDAFDYSECDENTKLHLQTKYKPSVYARAELMFLKAHKVKFHVKSGAWTPQEGYFTFDETMLQKVKGRGIYAIWAGRCGMVNPTSNVKVYCPNKETAALLQSQTDGAVYGYEDNEVLVKTERPVVRHRTHILAYIAAYARIHTLTQLLKFQHKDVLKVNADGIFYRKDAKFECLPLFREKPAKFNTHGSSYLSYVETPGIEVEYLEHYKTEARRGAGGTGKSHVTLTDQGFRGLVFTAISWFLCIDKAVEYGVPTEVLHLLLTEGTMSNYREDLHPAVIVVDEATMLNVSQFERLKQMYPWSKLIFLGDWSSKGIPYQVPCVKGTQFTHLLCDHSIKFTKNYRIKCGYLQKLCKQLRRTMRKRPFACRSVLIAALKDKTVEAEKIEWNDDYFILASTNTQVDEFNTIIDPTVEDSKKRFMYTRTAHKDGKLIPNGTIVMGTPQPAGTKLAYAATIHKAQGRTLESKLYISTKKMFCVQMAYTAASRCRRLDQLYLL